ncbi:replication protein A 70 kDa DNA-binding subunit B-like isoform X1 [Nicotiana sylvestris]|uniref:Uncharacterized protein LOC104214830 n=1 Tax=Nicotiana sylvestris TaxID=4096 RepID=A0A1U7VKI4_NICSY|nr:PREDICTED: uncharacterized protein LOC104214830 [Nicotiana sylvestris]
MQLVRAHRFREQYSVRNTWHASKLWINSNLPQVVDFCSRMVSVRRESSQRITQISSQKTHSVANKLASGSIEVKNVEDLSDCNHLGNYWVVATIIHVELDRGWCYLACKNCSKKLEKAGNKFYCKKCEQIQSVTHRYRLQVKVMDCTGTISLLLWDKDATKIIGKSANDLKDVVFETSGAADDSSCPMEIENIVEKGSCLKLRLTVPTIRIKM